MSKLAIVQTMLTREYPDESELAGPTNTADIVRLVFDGVPPDSITKDVAGGQNLSLTEAMTLLAAVTTIVKNAIEVRAASKRIGESPEDTKNRMKRIIDAVFEQGDGI